ncbi:MAG: sialate O-acetylesterase [Armatimonadota bacterium]
MRKFAVVLCTILISASCTRFCLASVTMTSPGTRQVVQRNSDNYAQVQIAGMLDGVADRIEARAFVMAYGSGQSISWTKVAGKTKNGAFSGKLKLDAGGWYRIEIRAIKSGDIVDSTAIEKVGVGEVFVTAGQSNSTNYGFPKTTPIEDRVSAWNGKEWQFAADPQPIASDDSSQNGSPWPSLGDELVKRLDVPIGFISTGWGGSAVSQWNADGILYPRLGNALRYLGKHGERAILWHQGETDMVLGTSTELYMKLMRSLIEQSRKDAGWDVPWLIAGVSFMPSQQFGTGLAPKMKAIREAQRQLADDESIFQGPTTDNMVGPGWRSDTVHFNEKGLKEHGRRWADVLMKTFFEKSE